MRLTATPEQPNVIIQNGNGNEYISIFNSAQPEEWFIGSNQSDATCLPCFNDDRINKIDWGWFEQECEITISFDECLIDTNGQRYARISEFWGTRPTRRP